MIELDGTDNKKRLGANAILGVSLAVAKAAADSADLPLFRYLGGPNAHVLPVPMMNIINGGAHADTGVDIQEFMVLPIGAESFSEALRWGVETYHSLKSLLKKKGLNTGLGDEGGFAPELEHNRAALDLISRGDRGGRLHGRPRHRARARRRIHRVLRERRLPLRGPGAHAPPRCRAYYAELAANYPLVSIEDPLAEDDWEGWAHLNSEIGSKLQLVGDDLFVTNPKRLAQGIAARRPPTASSSRSTRSARSPRRSTRSPSPSATA